MARKAPSKARKSRLPPLLGNPLVIALAAVVAVFAVALGVSRLTGGRNAGTPGTETVRVQQPSAPPTAKPAPPVSVAVGAEAADPPIPAVPPPPAASSTLPAPAVMVPAPTTLAMLPPPAPAVPAVQPPPGNAALWRRNALPTVVPPGRPMIAIVIDDLGLDRKRSARTVALRGPLTLSWLPYAHDLADQTRAARAAGHELMLHMPMEPSVHADPGPDALLVSLDKAEVMRRFRNALDSFDGYVGVNNHMGSRFTADRAQMAPVLAELHRRGLLWLDSRTTASSAGVSIAQELKMPYAGRDIFLDNTETVAAVNTQLAKVEQVARHQGSAIAIGHPHDATIQALASWLPEVQKRGFVLVPVSAVVRTHHAGG